MLGILFSISLTVAVVAYKPYKPVILHTLPSISSVSIVFNQIIICSYFNNFIFTTSISVLKSTEAVSN